MSHPDNSFIVFFGERHENETEGYIVRAEASPMNWSNYALSYLQPGREIFDIQRDVPAHIANAIIAVFPQNFMNFKRSDVRRSIRNTVQEMTISKSRE